MSPKDIFLSLKYLLTLKVRKIIATLAVTRSAQTLVDLLDDRHYGNYQTGGHQAGQLNLKLAK